MDDYINFSDLSDQIRCAGYDCCDPKMDSWSTWELKKKLYHLKWQIDDILRRAPVFSSEQEWLHEEEKKRLINYLKGK